MKIVGLSRLVSAVKYIIYLVIIIAAFDVFIFHDYLGYGYPRHFDEENTLRFPAPYVAFTGKPNAKDHNEFGFRGPSFRQAGPDDFKIAFFGGSTGYNGSPPIAQIVERKLEALLGLDVFVANYSVTSSNHRQHLHGIIEFLPQFKPDLVIFYGGYNETIQSAKYDPRPGYPFNYYYRSETRPFFKLLLENSALMGAIDERTGMFSGINKLRAEQQPLSGDWNKRIVDKYFETLKLAKDVTGTIESRHFGNTEFLAFYQPFPIPEEFASAHNSIKNRLDALEYAFNVSSEYDALGKDVYSDYVHVNQQAKEVMGAKIARIVDSQYKSRRSFHQ